MTIEEFITIVKQAFPVSANSITHDTVYKDLVEWNSLTAIILITEISKQYKVRLSPADIFENETVDDLFKYISDLV